MFRGLVRATAVCGLLVAGYFGYCRGFVLVAASLGAPRTVPIVPADPQPAATQRHAMKLAEAAFGKGHWTCDPKKSYTYYDEARGYWMFFQNYAPAPGRRRIDFAPFAVISKSRGKQNLNTIQGTQAWVEFDKPFDLAKPGDEPAKVVRARIEGEVRVRDDKGTRDNPGDDLTIGPMTWLEYNETTHELTTDSDIELREADIVATGLGARIVLRRPPPAPAPAPVAAQPPRPAGSSGGFHGVELVEIYKNIHISVENVGRTGIVPGGKSRGGPGDLTAEGPAEIRMPPPRPKDAPPAPPDPVIAVFYKNVIVRQGDPQQRPDRLLCDVLTLDLRPAPEKPKAEPADAPALAKTDGAPAAEAPGTPPADDPMGGLALHRAEATGHQVWLESPVQGTTAFGNELHYERHAPESPDLVYFRGDKETRVEKINYARNDDTVGVVESVDHIFTKDVTIYQGLNAGEPPTVIAGGPGRFETRPAAGGPPDVTAHWADRLVIRNVVKEPTGEPRRAIVLTGNPQVASRTQGTLDARDRIEAYLKPRAAAPGDGATPEPSAGPARGSLQIDWMIAVNDVRMVTLSEEAAAGTAPGGQRTLLLANRFEAVFAPPAGPAPAAPAPPPPAAPPAPAAEPAPPAEGEAAPDAAPPKAPPPAMIARADSGWAQIALASRQSKPELQKVFLRGGVDIHQDPEPGKARGTDIRGDSVDLFGRGGGLVHVEVHGTPKVPAYVTNETLLIEGVKLGLDQATDYAWSRGVGRLVQEPPPSRETTPDEAADAAAPPASAPDDRGSVTLSKGPVEIRWTQEMEFLGRPGPIKDSPNGQAVAYFRGGVRGKSVDADLSCGAMTALLDAPVSFQRGPRDPNAPPAPKPRIAVVRCQKDVDLVHRRVDPETRELIQKGHINGALLVYQLDTGRFEVPGEGIARLYKPKGAEAATAPARTAPPAARRPVSPAPGVRPIADRPAGPTRPQAPPAPRRLPLELTRITFQRGVEGRFGRGEPEPGGPKPDSPIEATFRGGVQAINAIVPDDRADIDPDSPPERYMLLTAESLKVIRERPATVPRPGDPAEDQMFLDATGNPHAISPPQSIAGDRITYDSNRELIYVYGDDKGVRIVQQEAPGQPFSATQARAVMYNRKTGQFLPIDPSNALLIDPRSGVREGPQPQGRRDEEPKAPVDRKRRSVPRSDKERKGFTGR